MSRDFLWASQRAAGSLREVTVPLCCMSGEVKRFGRARRQWFTVGDGWMVLERWETMVAERQPKLG